MSNDNLFDLVVLGGGHAGLEAVNISSKLGLKVCLITLDGVGIASMPCNPSIGGAGKSQVVREIDLLGGVMGKLADDAAIQYRTLNLSKGPAVYASRAQIDKDIYSKNAETLVNKLIGVELVRTKIVSISKNPDSFKLTDVNNSSFHCKQLIVTAGTFLNGKLHTGSESSPGGRNGCEKSFGLNEIFSDLKSEYRFKTGTPARILKDSINFSVLEKQVSDDSSQSFHFFNDWSYRGMKQTSCFLAYTNKTTMNIISENLEKSPMFNGSIGAVGARYCPSIEDKAFRYPDKSIHHVFLEPEGFSSELIYPSGVSSSLPKEIQLKFLRSIVGLEECEIALPGYAVEYDVVDTSKLSNTLEYDKIEGLFFAGQVNGTSGYEEAAGQGLVAGINASFNVKSKGKRFVLGRNDSYIGVMIEDLVTNKRDEPYRLFTSRAENRLGMREDNTFLRMASYRNMLALNDDESRKINEVVSDFSIYSTFIESINSSKAFLQPGSFKSFNGFFEDLGVDLNKRLSFCLEIELKYAGYLKRHLNQSKKQLKLDRFTISPTELVNNGNLSFECRQRIKQIMPATFGQLKKINGIRPSTLAYVAGQLK